MSVSLLLSMPAASGLFHQAIAQSGAAEAAKSLETAALDTEEFMAAAGATTVAELVAAPPQQLLAAHATMSLARMADPEGVIARTGSPLGFLAFRPVADGEILPDRSARRDRRRARPPACRCSSGPTRTSGSCSPS